MVENVLEPGVGVRDRGEVWEEVGASDLGEGYGGDDGGSEVGGGGGSGGPP